MPPTRCAHQHINEMTLDEWHPHLCCREFARKWFHSSIYVIIYVIHSHPLQGKNCDSNSRLVMDEDGNGKLRLRKGSCNLLNIEV